MPIFPLSHLKVLHGPTHQRPHRNDHRIPVTRLSPSFRTNQRHGHGRICWQSLCHAIEPALRPLPQRQAVILRSARLFQGHRGHWSRGLLPIVDSARSRLPLRGTAPARMLSKIPSLSRMVGQDVIQPGYPHDKRGQAKHDLTP